MSYRWLEHTGELELEIDGSAETDVFEAALDALAELLARKPTGAPEHRDIIASAHDRPALLAAWLEELVFLAETEGYVAQQVVEIAVRAGEVSATLEGYRCEPRHLVKAVTYHNLAFARDDRRWHARVVLDV